ncbi:MAG: hypothetical protein WAM04_19755 [Candidatus Sulfotelmatobacter sp.]
MRYYRFCQNEFDSVLTAFDLIKKCSETRKLSLFYTSPQGERVWLDDDTNIKHHLEKHPNALISVAAGPALKENASRGVELTGMEVNRLYLSLLYKVANVTNDRMRLVKTIQGPDDRGETHDISKSRLDTLPYLSYLYRRGIVVSLPPRFASTVLSLPALQQL